MNKKKIKEFDCVEMMHEGQAEVRRKLAGNDARRTARILAQANRRVARPSAAGPGAESHAGPQGRKLGRIVHMRTSF
jgi:hypothetical protein